MAVHGWLISVQMPKYPAVPIKTRDFRIGRGHENELMVDDPRVSRSVTRLRVDDNGCVVMCDGGGISAAGHDVILNSRVKIDLSIAAEILLEDGDEIHLAFSRKKPQRNISFRFSKHLDLNTNCSQQNNMLRNSLLSLQWEFEAREVRDTVVRIPVQQPRDIITNKMRRAITCSICDQTLQEPLALLPCLCTFCTICLKSIEYEKSLCPHCGMNVKRCVPNWQVNNLVNALMARHPNWRPNKESNYIENFKEPSMSFLTGITAKEKGERNPNETKSSTNESTTNLTTTQEDSSEEESESDDSFLYEYMRAGTPPTEVEGENTVADPYSDPGTDIKGYMRCECCSELRPDRRAEVVMATCALCGVPRCARRCGCGRACIGTLRRWVASETTTFTNHYETMLFLRWLILAGVPGEDPFKDFLMVQLQLTVNFTREENNCGEKNCQLDYRLSDMVGSPLQPISPLCRSCAREIRTNFLIHHWSLHVTDAEKNLLDPRYTSLPICPKGRYCTRVFSEPAHAENHKHAVLELATGLVFDLKEIKNKITNPMKNIAIIAS